MQCRNDCFRTISPRKHGWCLRPDLWPTRSKVSIENVLCLVSGDISQILCPAQLLIGWLNCLMRTVLKYKARPTSHMEEAPPLFSTLWARAPSQGWAVAISTHMWCAAINTGPGGTIRAAYPSITFFALHQILYSTVSTKAHVCFTNTWDTLTRKHRFQFPHHHFKFQDMLKTSFKSSFGNFLRTSPQNSLARFLLQLLRSLLLPSFTARKKNCSNKAPARFTGSRRFLNLIGIFVLSWQSLLAISKCATWQCRQPAYQKRYLASQHCSNTDNSTICLKTLTPT